MSHPLAGVSNWDVWTATTLGSDHYAVSCLVGERVEMRQGGVIPKWIFGKADWDKFQKVSEEIMERIDIYGDIDEINNQVTSAIITAADDSISSSKNRMNS